MGATKNAHPPLFPLSANWAPFQRSASIHAGLTPILSLPTCFLLAPKPPLFQVTPIYCVSNPPPLPEPSTPRI